MISVAVCAVILIISAIIGAVGAHRDQLRSRESMQPLTDKEINLRLWQLLKDEDPAWLSAMGIEGPVAEQSWLDEAVARAKEPPGLPLGLIDMVEVDHPGQIHYISANQISADKIVAGVIRF